MPKIYYPFSAALVQEHAQDPALLVAEDLQDCYKIESVDNNSCIVHLEEQSEALLFAREIPLAYTQIE